MKKIGIFLAYAPGQSLKNQGISRLLSFILNGILKDNKTKITIAMPGWFEKSITDFMQDQKIDINQIELLTTKGNPHILRIVEFFKRRKNRFFIKKNSKHTIFTNDHGSPLWILKIIMPFISTRSTALFVLSGLIFFVLGVAFLPFILFSFILLSVFNLLKKSYARINKIIKFIFNIIKIPFIHYKYKVTPSHIYHELRKCELRKLIALINNRPDISVWFIPTLFWPEIKLIKAIKVVAAPDVVFVDFPMYFNDKYSLLTYKIISETISVADHLICYSDHVKQNHLIKSFGVEPSKISVIPHGAIDLSKYFKNSDKEMYSERNQSIDILHDYQRKKLCNHPYLSNFHLSSMRFIFYSSQIRSYKNFHALIQAYEILLRKRYLNIKLVITGDIHAHQEIYNYIINKRLQFDVLSFHDVSSEMLAALNHLSICAVNPTLFEGGFPFTFAEAYSVGAPSVMSDIPVTQAYILDKTLRDHMLFNPNNIEDMADKIEWAIENREELLDLQKPLYQKFHQRSWSFVASEYIDVLEKCSTFNSLSQN